MSNIRVADALACGRKDEKNKAGQDSCSERQIEEQLLGVAAGTHEEATLDAGVAEGHGQEDDGSEECVQEIDELYLESLEVREGAGGLIVGAIVVEYIEAFEGGEAVVELPVPAHKAIGEGEDDAGDEAEIDEKGCQVLVRHGAIAVVSE